MVESQAGSSHAALFFYCTITALHARHCQHLEVLVSRIKFRAADCIQRGVRELLLGTGHQAMLSLHTTVGPQPGGVKISNSKSKWQRKQKLGPCKIWYLEKKKHVEQEFSSYVVNMQISSLVLFRTRNCTTRKKSQ